MYLKEAFLILAAPVCGSFDRFIRELVAATGKFRKFIDCKCCKGFSTPV